MLIDGKHCSARPSASRADENVEVVHEILFEGQCCVIEAIVKLSA